MLPMRISFFCVCVPGRYTLSDSLLRSPVGQFCAGERQRDRAAAGSPAGSGGEAADGGGAAAAAVTPSAARVPRQSRAGGQEEGQHT